MAHPLLQTFPHRSSASLHSLPVCSLWGERFFVCASRQRRCPFNETLTEQTQSDSPPRHYCSLVHTTAAPPPTTPTTPTTLHRRRSRPRLGLGRGRGDETLQKGDPAHFIIPRCGAKTNTAERRQSRDGRDRWADALRQETAVLGPFFRSLPGFWGTREGTREGTRDGTRDGTRQWRWGWLGWEGWRVEEGRGKVDLTLIRSVWGRPGSGGR